jgi:carbamoylphosphate synthase large subunit
LQCAKAVTVVTPKPSPDPAEHTGWCFPDTEEGILAALEKNVTHLWANTILFAGHPLQTSSRIAKYQNTVKVIGQPPCLAEKYDDKDYVNNLLRSTKQFTLPRGWSINNSSDLELQIKNLNLPFPVVAKPVRGRGSFGVKVCHDARQLLEQARVLLEDSSSIIIEEYLSDEEATITVMPPSMHRPEYWSMPIIRRFNHMEGVAPYSGIVAVTANSSAVTKYEFDNDACYKGVARECAEVARLLGVTAPIRIDVRRFRPQSAFALFDVNMKPVSLLTDDNFSGSLLQLRT